MDFTINLPLFVTIRHHYNVSLMREGNVGELGKLKFAKKALPCSYKVTTPHPKTFLKGFNLFCKVEIWVDTPERTGNALLEMKPSD